MGVNVDRARARRFEGGRSGRFSEQRIAYTAHRAYRCRGKPSLQNCSARYSMIATAHCVFLHGIVLLGKTISELVETQSGESYAFPAFDTMNMPSEASG